MKDKKKGGKLYIEPGHFYSPICNVEEVTQYWESDHRAAQYARVDALLDYDAMAQLWAEIQPLTLHFPMNPTEGFRYYGYNSEFMYYDATILSGMLARFNPRQIIEIGAGYSSAAMFDTVDRMASPRLERFTTIDPDMTRLNALNPPETSQRLQAMVQTIPVDTFRELEAGDLFFIDSSHVLKTGSDVHYEYLHLLPQIKPGVIIHIHDIFYPFEYPGRWVMQHNRSWNEVYLVDMMLSYSRDYEVLFFNDAMLQKHPDLMQQGGMVKRFGAVKTEWRQRNNGSIWLRKR